MASCVTDFSLCFQPLMRLSWIEEAGHSPRAERLAYIRAAPRTMPAKATDLQELPNDEEIRFEEVSKPHAATLRLPRKVADGVLVGYPCVSDAFKYVSRYMRLTNLETSSAWTPREPVEILEKPDGSAPPHVEPWPATTQTATTTGWLIQTNNSISVYTSIDQRRKGSTYRNGGSHSFDHRAADVPLRAGQ